MFNITKTIYCIIDKNAKTPNIKSVKNNGSTIYYFQLVEDGIQLFWELKTINNNYLKNKDYIIYEIDQNNNIISSKRIPHQDMERYLLLM